MTYKEACDKARKDSEKGYVQHVNRSITHFVANIKPVVDENGYYISDWYDCDKTVASFENGKDL